MLQLQFPPLAAEEVSLDTLMTYFRTRNYPVEEVETAKCRQGDRYYPAARRVRVETEIADSAPRLILLSRYVYREATKTDEAAPVQVKSRVTMPDQIAGKRLLAVIRHYGTSPRNGHYVAAIRENEQWYLANDHYVRLLSVEETRDMIAAGYIYYYG
jgi:ubiquitin C-terminal hydrolase